MDSKTKICIWIILIGLANFLAYTILYVFIGGEAVNGRVVEADGQLHYYLQSWHQVGYGEFLYSGIHSISIWVTVAAVMLAMLTLAKDRVVSSMHSTIVNGRTLMTILATVIALTMAVITIWFILKFARTLANPIPMQQIPPPSARLCPSGGDVA